MDRTTTRRLTRAGAGLVVVLALLGTAGCGDDDDGSAGSGPGGDSGTGDAAGEGGAPSTDECDVLETSEVEAQFAGLGPVADVYLAAGLNCTWEIGDQEGFGTPEGFGDHLSVRQFRGDNGMSMEENWGPGEPVQGLAEEAWFTGSTLAFRQGDLTVGLSTSFDPEVEDLRGKLTALAELILGRV